MLERSGPVLRIICLGLAALLLVQFVRLVARRDPLKQVIIPAGLFSLTGTNTQADRKDTDSVAGHESGKKSANPPSANTVMNREDRAMNSGPSREGTRGSSLPPAIQARVDRITQSEILGPVMRPLPMALLGIAGKDAFIRAPGGQTGLLREGEELGGVKLLRIGTNRVLIELEGQTKELSVFSGFGSETLLPGGKEITP
ncbi:MAG: hypothetical protein ABI651_13945 [Verrucomicrobiota bacterium]